MTNFERNKQWLIACGKTPTIENLSVAIGVQLEEICEFLGTIRSDSEGYGKLLERTRTDLDWFAGKLKRREQFVYIPIHLRVDALDSLCDIEVTGNGVAYLAGFDKDSADQAVLDSNDSKLEDGNPVFVEGTTKIGKGKNYQAPDLRKFV
jgi:predicted HAD superfamily Cof-like phosphohydrolase